MTLSSVPDSADVSVALGLSRSELVNVLCACLTHTLSHAFTGKKVTPNSESAHVPVAFPSSRGALVYSIHVLYSHTSDPYFSL